MQMSESQLVINAAVVLAVVIGCTFLGIQHFSYWRKYGGKENLIWIVATVLALILAACFILTRFFSESLDPSLLGLFTVLRRILIVVVLIAFILIGFREYVWKK
jgi:hypothetical protein